MEINTHVLIAMIAAVFHALAGNESPALAWAGNARSPNPALTPLDFFRAFPTQSGATRARVAAILPRLGF